MEKRAVVIRYFAFEDLGILAPLLSEAGYAVTYCEAGVHAFDAQMMQADLLVVLGGGLIGVNDVSDYPWLEQELEWIRARLQQKHTIGICLGAQLMAAAA